MTMNNETPPLLSTVGFRCKKCGYLGPVHRDVIGHTLACPSCSCEAFRHEEGISDKLERIEKENAQLCRELEAARHEREQAVQESNRRDQKWMDGIDSICGRKLRYTLATINDAPGFDLVPDLQDFITSLQSQLSKAEEERDRMRDALKNLLAAHECADETGYVDDVGFMDVDAILKVAHELTDGQPLPQTEGRDGWRERDFSKDPITEREQSIIDEGWKKHVEAGRCKLPPTGWRCTRTAGHEGPCAAIEEHSQPEQEGGTV
jgi:hypothetical protein